LKKEIHTLPGIDMKWLLFFLSFQVFAQTSKNPFYYDFLLEENEQMAGLHYESGIHDFDDNIYNANFKTKENLYDFIYNRGFRNNFHLGVKASFAHLGYEKEKSRSESGLKELVLNGKWLLKQTENGFIYLRPYLHLPTGKRDLSGGVPGEIEGNGVRGAFIGGSTLDFQFSFERFQAVGFLGLELDEAQKLEGDNVKYNLPHRMGTQWGLKAQFSPIEELTISMAKTFARYQRSAVHFSQPFEGKQQDIFDLTLGMHLKLNHNVELGYRKIQNTLRVIGNSSEITATSDQNWLAYTYQF
jgi:hypothetical protein